MAEGGWVGLAVFTDMFLLGENCSHWCLRTPASPVQDKTALLEAENPQPCEAV